MEEFDTKYLNFKLDVERCCKGIVSNMSHHCKNIWDAKEGVEYEGEVLTADRNRGKLLIDGLTIEDKQKLEELKNEIKKEYKQKLRRRKGLRL